MGQWDRIALERKTQACQPWKESAWEKGMGGRVKILSANRLWGRAREARSVGIEDSRGEFKVWPLCLRM